jgi:hypothetical protein
MSKQVVDSNTQLKNKIGNELLNYNATHNINTSLIDEQYLDEISIYISKAKLIMDENPYNDLEESKQDELYRDLSIIYKNMREKINDIPINLTLLGSQCKEVSKAIKNATYSAETLFWGIKVEQNILNNIDKTKMTNEDVQTFDVPMLELVMLHSILSSNQFNGLSFESYLIAKLIIDITEFIKVYNHLNARLDQLSRSIDSWEKGLEVKLNSKF